MSSFPSKRSRHETSSLADESTGERAVGVIRGLARIQSRTNRCCSTSCKRVVASFPDVAALSAHTIFHLIRDHTQRNNKRTTGQPDDRFACRAGSLMRLCCWPYKFDISYVVMLSCQTQSVMLFNQAVNIPMRIVYCKQWDLHCVLMNIRWIETLY